MVKIVYNQRLGLPPDDGEPRTVVLLTLSPTPLRPTLAATDEPTPNSGESMSTPEATPAEAGSIDGSPGSES
jgi:hypothetical protein